MLLRISIFVELMGRGVVESARKIRRENSYRKGLAEVRPDPTSGDSLSSIAARRLTPIVGLSLLIQRLGLGHLNRELIPLPLYAAAPQVPARYMVAVFGTPSGVPAK